MSFWDWAVEAVKGIDAGDVLNAGVNIGGALLSNDATKDAIDTQTAAGDKALALQKEMYDQSRQDLAPYRESGNAANAKLSQLMGLATPFDGNAYRTKLLADHPLLFGGTAPTTASAAHAGYSSADEQMAERLQMYSQGRGTGGAPDANARAAQRLQLEYNRVKDIPDGETNKYTGEAFNKAEYLAGINKQLENMAYGKNEGLFGQAAREQTPEGIEQRDKIGRSIYVPSKSKNSFLGKYGAALAIGALTGGMGYLAAPAALAGAGSTALTGANIAKNAFSLSSMMGKK